MNYTRPQVQNAILLLAKGVNKESSFKALFESMAGLPQLVQMISYELFLNQFDSRSCSAELYEAYTIVLKYATELRERGEVKFTKLG